MAPSHTTLRAISRLAGKSQRQMRRRHGSRAVFAEFGPDIFSSLLFADRPNWPRSNQWIWPLRGVRAMVGSKTLKTGSTRAARTISLNYDGRTFKYQILCSARGKDARHAGRS